METPKAEQLDQLLEDISTIKSVLRQNASILRQMLLPRHFRFISALAAIVILLDSYLYYYFSSRYGVFSNFPVGRQRLFIIAIIVSFLVVAVVKWVLWIRSLEKSGSKLSVNRVWGEIFASRIVHTYLPVIVLGVILSVYFISYSLDYYIIPTVAICLGFIYNTIGAATHIRQYLISGYWFMVTGALTIAGIWSGPVSISVTFGGGLLLFAVIPVGRE